VGTRRRVLRAGGGGPGGVGPGRPVNGNSRPRHPHTPGEGLLSHIRSARSRPAPDA